MKQNQQPAHLAVMNSTNKPLLKIDWATHEAAKFACLNWHYSKTLPVGKMVKVGAWENGKFIGVVLFSWGANKSLGSPYSLKMEECCELVRIALTSHHAPVSKITALAIRFLKKQSPGIRLIVSFADPSEGHHGGIYQAGNWIYSGTCSPSFEYRLNGDRLNKRAFTGNQFGKIGSKSNVPFGAVKVFIQGKHRYLMPLDKQRTDKIKPLSKPYPKRVKKQDSEHPSELGGAVPTDTLHIHEVQP
jgi:hypothetical protein